MKPITLLGASIIIMVILISAVAAISNKNEVPANHVEVVLREIGHELLLTANDSTSRVLPIKKLSDNKYQVSFQKNVGFISDSIINIVERTFQKNQLANSYIVNLKDCEANVRNNSLGETVLAFEVNSKFGSLTPCRGRKLEMGCYVLEIDFLKQQASNSYWLLLLLFPLGVAGFYLRGRFKKREVIANGNEEELITANDAFIPLGSFQFYPENNLLKIKGKAIMLSDKETKGLHIFANNIDQIVEREQLMKEIWEDEGIVVISRNVDVLVSKLRKKLSDDSAIKIINVHGKGYKFIVSPVAGESAATT